MRRIWQRRFFVLYPSALVYYTKKPPDARILGVLPLETYHFIAHLEESNGRRFDLLVAGASKRHTFYLLASSRDVASTWVRLIKLAVQKFTHVTPKFDVSGKFWKIPSLIQRYEVRPRTLRSSFSKLTQSFSARPTRKLKERTAIAEDQMEFSLIDSRGDLIKRSLDYVIAGLLKKRGQKKLLGGYNWQEYFFQVTMWGKNENGERDMSNESRLMYSKERGGKTIAEVPMSLIKSVHLHTRDSKTQFDVVFTRMLEGTSETTFFLQTKTSEDCKRWLLALSKQLVQKDGRSSVSSKLPFHRHQASILSELETRTRTASGTETGKVVGAAEVFATREKSASLSLGNRGGRKEISLMDSVRTLDSPSTPESKHSRALASTPLNTTSQDLDFSSSHSSSATKSSTDRSTESSPSSPTRVTHQKSKDPVSPKSPKSPRLGERLGTFMSSEPSSPQDQSGSSSPLTPRSRGLSGDVSTGSGTGSSSYPGTGSSSFLGTGGSLQSPRQRAFSSGEEVNLNLNFDEFHETPGSPGGSIPEESHSPRAPGALSDDHELFDADDDHVAEDDDLASDEDGDDQDNDEFEKEAAKYIGQKQVDQFKIDEDTEFEQEMEAIIGEEEMKKIKEEEEEEVEEEKEDPPTVTESAPIIQAPPTTAEKKEKPKEEEEEISDLEREAIRSFNTTSGRASIKGRKTWMDGQHFRRNTEAPYGSISEDDSSKGLDGYVDVDISETKTSSASTPYHSYALLTKKGAVPGSDKQNQDRGIALGCFAEADNRSFFGVFDGHGPAGHVVSEFVSSKLPTFVAARLKGVKEEEKERTKIVGHAIEEAFLACNSALIETPVEINYSGTTAIVCILEGKTMYMCNVGDSRGVLVRRKDSNYEVREVSVDHKPTRVDEKERIQQAGGRIGPKRGAKEGAERVWLKDKDVPGLSVTRSFGDNIAASVGVTAVPEIQTLSITDDDAFIVLASDGVWEFLTTEQVVEIIAEQSNAKDCARMLVEEAVASWEQESEDEARDDITCVVIFLQPIIPVPASS